VRTGTDLASSSRPSARSRADPSGWCSLASYRRPSARTRGRGRAPGTV